MEQERMQAKYFIELSKVIEGGVIDKIVFKLNNSADFNKDIKSIQDFLDLKGGLSDILGDTSNTQPLPKKPRFFNV